MTEFSKLIQAVARNEPGSAKKLLPLVYDELRRLAQVRLAKEKPGQTLDATGLVHEAYLRLVGTDENEWNHRGHFFAAAAEAMRRILIENARRRSRQKRGGDFERIELADDLAADGDKDGRLLDLDEALGKLQLQDKRKSKLVELRFFVGLTNEQAADVLGISPATAARDWAYA